MEINIVITAAGGGQVRAVMYPTSAPHLERECQPGETPDLANATVTVEPDAIRIVGDDTPTATETASSSSTPHTINSVTGSVAGTVTQYGNTTGSVTFHH